MTIGLVGPGMTLPVSIGPFDFAAIFVLLSFLLLLLRLVDMCVFVYIYRKREREKNSYDDRKGRERKRGERASETRKKKAEGAFSYYHPSEGEREGVCC